MSMKIAVMGAPGTGKSSLVAALQTALSQDAGPSAACSVSESAALEPAEHYDLILLMGLDLPPQAPNHDSRSALSPAQRDAHLRQLLNQTARAYTVVYGTGQARTDCALQAIDYHRRQTTERPTAASTTWHWNCENCSDAACENRLFSSLVKQSGDSMRQ